MNIYYCWITALVPQYQDGIIAGMVKKGYMVGAAAKDGNVTSHMDNRSAALIALNVYKIADGDIPVTQVYDDLLAVLVEMKAFYHSIVVTAMGGATWVGSNIPLPVKEKAQPPPLPPDIKKNMN